MRLRLATLVATLLLAGCASKQQSVRYVAPPPITARSIDRENKTVASISGAELRVRLNQDLGAAASPVKDNFTARLVEPIVGPNGRVLIPVGSLVWGHVVHVDEASRRVEIAFDRLETRTAVYRLSATVLSAHPFAVTVRPEGLATMSPTVILQGNAPSAIGGGPPVQESESEEGAPRGDVIVPFDAELRLKITAPLIATSAVDAR